MVVGFGPQPLRQLVPIGISLTTTCGTSAGGKIIMAVALVNSELSDLQDQDNEMRTQLTAVTEDSNDKI
jgi:hypothetical protein